MLGGIWMEALKLILAELAKLKEKKGILFSVIAVLLVPVVYAAILLSPTWHPYDNLSNLPVAVVNKDKGAVSRDKEINAGRDLVEEFKKTNDLGWKFVSEKEAQEGLRNLEYYMVIEIPEDFSQKITTVLEDKPQKPELKYIQNEGLNFLASSVTSNATDKIREKLGDKITQTYVENIFSQLKNVSEGFQSAADGSEQIHDGTDQLKDGTGQILSALKEKSGDIDRLADGSKQLAAGTNQLYSSLSSKQGDISKLANGAKQLNDGTGLLLSSLKEKSPSIQQLNAGAKQLNQGLNKLEKGTEDLLNGLETAKKQVNDGLGKLQPGSASLSEGLNTLSQGATQLSAGMKQVDTKLQQFLKANPQLSAIPDVQQLAGTITLISQKLEDLDAGAKQLNAGAAQLKGGIDQLGTALEGGFNQLIAGQKQIHAGVKSAANGSSQLAAGTATVQSGWSTLTSSVSKLDQGASQIKNGNQTVNQGWQQLTQGASKLNTGAQQISEGNVKVQKGWTDLTDGVTKVDDGVGKLNEGSFELATGLKEGAEKTSSLKVNNDNMEMFASPVTVSGSKINEYQYYRDSSAPYILSLGLFVGILVMSFIIDFRKPAIETNSRFGAFTGKFLTLAILTIIQAVIVTLFALTFLNLQVQSGFGLILFAIFVSLTFLAIIFFLVAAGGNLGRFIALIFIVLQLSITGSNLPIEMLPENLRNLSAYLPLTYSNAGFKSLISIEQGSAVGSSSAILGIYLAIFLILTIITFFVKSNRQQTVDAVE